MTQGYWDRLAARRMTRRRVLQASGATAAAAGAVWLAGCGGSTKTVATPGAQDATPAGAGDPSKVALLNEKQPPVPGGRLIVGVPGAFDSFDPHLTVVTALAFMPRIYNTLVNQSATRPEFMYFDLAQSVETPDPLTWVFKLRPGVRIGPNPLGVPERDLDGQDVVTSFERIKSSPTATNGGFAKEFVDSITASGDTVTLKTTKPYAWLISRAGNFANTIAPRELFADDEMMKKIRTQSAGGGPFRLVSSTEGDGAVMDRNPSYYRHDEANGGAQLPYVDGLDVRIFTDRTAWRTAFQSKQLHYYVADSKDEADSFAADSAVFVQKAPQFMFVPITMNPEKPPFNDPRARRAVSRALNRDDIIDVVYRGDAKPNGLVHWPCGVGTYAFSADELKELQPYDVADAKALVSALGGLKVTVTYPTGAPIAQHDRHVPIVLRQLRDAGIEVSEDALPLTTWLDHYRSRDYTITIALTQNIESPELPLKWHTANGPAGDKSYGVGLGDPDIEAALEKTNTTLDFQGRVEAVRAAQKLIYTKDPTFLPLVCGYAYTAYSSQLHNVPDGLGTTMQFLNGMWLEA